LPVGDVQFALVVAGGVGTIAVKAIVVVLVMVAV
jgi:hypothetical protein